MPFGFGKPTVLITVIDADDGTVISKSKQQLDAIPLVFDRGTTIHLGDAEFDVLEAEPPDRETYSKLGRLTLKVRKAETQYINVNDVLFSLPTICNELPTVERQEKTAKSLLEIHEDDWRQIELVSNLLSERVDCQLEQIEAVYRNQRTAAGFFKSLHVRKDIRQPLANCKLPLTRLKTVVCMESEFDGFSFYNADGVVKNGFALATAGGLYLYGTCAPDSTVNVIGLSTLKIHTPTEAASALVRLLSLDDLRLVDWCQVSFVQSEQQLIRYFETTRD